MKSNIQDKQNIVNQLNTTRNSHRRTGTFNTIDIQDNNLKVPNKLSKSSKELREFPIIDHVKRNIERVKVNMLPYRDQVIQDGGLSKWHRTRRQVMFVNKPLSMFDDTHVFMRGSVRNQEDRVIQDIIKKDTGFNRKYDETLFCQ